MKILGHTLVAIILSVAPSSLPAQQPQHTPVRQDGNNLLDECSALLRLADSPDPTKAPDSDQMKLMWCEGYLRATRDSLDSTKINLAVLAVAGLKFCGPDKLQDHALEVIDPVSIPDKVSLLQLARVVVKWLQDHPERLHEPQSILIRKALQQAFPNPAVGPEPVKGTVSAAPQKPR